MELNQARNVVLRFDMRAAPFSPDTAADRYQAAIAMARWADQRAIDVVGLSEHHLSGDGFLSAPLQLAGMMAAVTERVRVSVSALLVPLHDPLRLAEDIALLDLASGGRFSATCGLGYRPEEYRAAGVAWNLRGAVFDDKLAILCSLLGGESAELNGQAVTLEPVPQSPLQALLLVGGNSAAAARRAARFGLMFSPAIDDIALADVYTAECERQGNRGSTIFPRKPATTFLSETPDRAWDALGEHLLYDATAYGAWRHPSRRAYAESVARDLEELKAEGKYRILTPDQALACIEETGSLHLAPLCGGTPIAAGWETLRLFENQVEPRL